MICDRLLTNATYQCTDSGVYRCRPRAKSLVHYVAQSGVQKTLQTKRHGAKQSALEQLACCISPGTASAQNVSVDLSVGAAFCHLQKVLPLNFRGTCQLPGVPKFHGVHTLEVREDAVILGTMGAKLHCFTEACGQDMDHARKLVANSKPKQRFELRLRAKT